MEQQHYRVALVPLSPGRTDQGPGQLGESPLPGPARRDRCWARGQEAGMARLRAVRGGWVVRACRVFYPDGNPLRRTVDRLEGALVAALGVAFLVLAPLAVVIAGH